MRDAMRRFGPWFFLGLSMVLSAAGADDSPPPANGERRGTFSGRVLTPEGKPIPGAVVTLPDLNDNGVLAKTRTNADGRFSLPVEENSERPIHRSLQKLLIEAEGYGADYVPGRRITLFPGEDKPLGEIIVEPGRTYRGRVLDSRGRPIAGAKVLGRSYGDRSGMIGGIVERTTGADGRYELPLLPPGRQYAVFEAKGFVARFVNEKAFEAAGSEGVLDDVVLEPDKPIAGVVKDKDGAPIPDAEVRANHHVGTTDAEGKFLLKGFGETARFQLQIRKDGYVIIDWGVHRTPAGFAHFEIKKMPPPPFAGGTLDAKGYQKALEEITTKSPELNITVQPAATIQGIATDAETGKPVRISRVLLCLFTRTKDGEVVLNGCRNSSFTQTQAGEFSLSYSFPTEYHLTVSAEGYEDAEAFTPKVTRLEDISGIEVKMKKKQKAGDDSPASFQQRLTGTVTDDGKPLETARVALWMPPRTLNAVNSHTIRGRTSTGDGNVLESTLLENGRFSLDVPYQGSNWYVLVETPQGVRALEGPLKIAKGQTRQIELNTKTLGTVRGKLTKWAKLDRPLWAVMFSKPGIQYETPVRDDGTFEFQNVFPGEYGLKAACESLQDSEIPNLPDASDGSTTLEEQFEIDVLPTRPWKRATRITVEEGETTEGISLRFEH